jgi:lysosomal acid phosphatase
VVLVAGRTILHTIISALERIAYNDDPLKFMLVETTYQPFISLFHQTSMTSFGERLDGIRGSSVKYSFGHSDRLHAKANYAGALAIELRRGLPPDTRDFLRFKFKNGTQDDFTVVHVFGHRSDIPSTEFIYRTEVMPFLSIPSLDSPPVERSYH